MQYSVVNYKTVKENPDFRIDGDCFVLLDEFIKRYTKNTGVITFSNESYIKIIDGDRGKNYPNRDDFSDHGYCVFLNTSNVLRNGFDLSTCQYITEEKDKRLGSGKMQRSDVVFTTRGTIGNIGIYNHFIGQNNIRINSGMVIYRLKQIIPEYFFIVLLSDYFKAQIKIYSSGSVQSQIPISTIKQLRIPMLPPSFQEFIKDVFNKSEEIINQSKSFYSQAEQLLLSELGLSDWKSKHELAFVKNFAETEMAERFDAEYFQPIYEEIIDAVKKYKNGFNTLDNLVKIKKGIEPGSEVYKESGVPFVRVSNLSKFELSDNNQQYISDDLYGELEDYQLKKDEILLSKDATPGIAYYLSTEPQRMIVSGGILRLKLKNKKVLPEYLTLVLNSVIVQKQIERDAGGSIINHWRPDQVQATLIPILKEDKQKEIKELVEKSFSDRNLSKSLLEIAKSGVEIAIEKTELEAEKWIQGELKKANL